MSALFCYSGAATTLPSPAIQKRVNDFSKDKTPEAPYDRNMQK